MTTEATKNTSPKSDILPVLPVELSEDSIIHSSAAIQISNDITLKQRQAWMAMLKNAFNYPDTTEEFVIDVRELKRVTKFSERNEGNFREMLQGIAGKSVRWNVLGKDRSMKPYGAFALLADIVVHGNTCVYAYGPIFRKVLRHPGIYATLSLSVASEFRSKYSLALWANVYGYYNDRKGIGETPWLTPKEARILLVGRGKKYKAFDEFKFLNRDVIKPALKEVAKIVKLFKVDIDYKRKGRKIEAIKFKARRDNEYYKKLQKQQATPIPEIITELTNAYVSIGEAKKIWTRQWEFVDEDKRPEEDTYSSFEVYVREKIDLGIRNIQQQKLSSGKQGAFIRTAIKTNYSNPEFFSKLVEHERQALEAKKEKLNGEEEDEHRKASTDMIQNDSSILEKVVENLDNSFISQWIEKYDSVQKAYQESPVVKAAVHTTLRKEMFPEVHTEIDQKYEKQLAEIDAKIQALE